MGKVAPAAPDEGVVSKNLALNARKKVSHLTERHTGRSLRIVPYQSSRNPYVVLHKKSKSATACVTSAIAALFIQFPPLHPTKTFLSRGSFPTFLCCTSLRSVQPFKKTPCEGPPAEESSGGMREVWREKGPPPKGGPFSLQGLLPSPLTFHELM